VAFTDGKYVGHTTSGDAAAVAAWVNERGAEVVAVDAPCTWSKEGKSRPCETELRRRGIKCFSTPNEHFMDVLETEGTDGQKAFYGWMKQGERLFCALSQSGYPLLRTEPVVGERFCFETFPHAIARELLGPEVQARKKREQRSKLLNDLCADFQKGLNIDFIDAGLCAYMAHVVATSGDFELLPERSLHSTGILVVPKSRHKPGVQ
jgi:predicted nuclease with RNAse H fold